MDAVNLLLHDNIGAPVSGCAASTGIMLVEEAVSNGESGVIIVTIYENITR